ncbi:MAG: hypothetical protein MJE77_11870 [Proteobacteria bacterium]|nr:hypothetical protein [Pseudomonadota bacterium]
MRSSAQSLRRQGTSHLLELQSSWSIQDILRAIEHASRYGAYNADAVDRILKATAQPRTLEDVIAESARHRIRQAMASSPVTQPGPDSLRASAVWLRP